MSIISRNINQSHSLGQASAPAVNQYIQLAQSLGIDTAFLLNQVGIEASLLADNSCHISGLKFQQLIELLIDHSNDPLFGLHTAQFVQPGSYSVLGFISMNCETLGEAIAKIKPFEKLVGDMGTTSFEQKTPYFKISWDCHFPNQRVRRHMIDNCLASWLTFARYLLDSPLIPAQVCFSSKPPNPEYLTEYVELFGCPISFNQPDNAILFDQKYLQLPLNKGNKQLLTTLEQHAEMQLNNLTSHKTIVEKTEQLIQQNLSTGKFHQQDIADFLGISHKTLQRRLKKENLRFQQLVDKVRLRYTIELLDNYSLSLNEISQLIGFNEPRSFYRWFARLTNKSPGQWRKNKPDRRLNIDAILDQ